MMRYLFLSLLIIGAGGTPALAAEMNASSRIESVTVFPDGAEVHRTFEATLEAGSNVLVLSNLPTSLAPNSVRVDGKATDGVEIGSVDTNRVVVKKPGSVGLDDSERKRIEDEIKRLTDERNAQDGIIKAAATQSAMAEKLSELPMFDGAGVTRDDNKDNSSNNAETFKQIDWNALFELVGSRIQSTAKLAQTAKIKQRELDEKIAVLREKLKLQPKEEWTRTEIRVNIDAKAAAKGTFSVRYLVSDALWQPVYDARLATGGKGSNPEITIVRRGAITQETGEDWENTKVTLSTMRATEATSAPDLNTLKVKFTQRFLARRRAPMSMMREMAPSAPKTESDREDGLEAEPLMQKPMKSRSAVVNITGYQATFEIPRPVTLRSGVGEKRVFISSEKQKVALFAKTAPRKFLSAFLHAKFTYEGAAPVLPGEVSLYRDDVFIGRGAFPLIAKGEEKELGFGRDDAVRVTRIELKRAKSETGLISASKVDEQRFKITVNNLHNWAIPVVVMDQMPVSENEEIIVTPHPETTKPTTTAIDDKRGVYAWNFDLKPNEEKAITIGYTLKWPAKRDVYMEDGSIIR
jgi:uncharacterized protein (TIGR02231 family)